MKRKICVITGSRADYGILFPVMKAIRSSKNLKLYIIATCMHLMNEFGYTFREIKKDFDVYKKIDTSYKEDSGEAMAFSVGKAISMLSECFAKIKPDLVLVMGDRGEMLAATITANYMNIPVAHIHGGEVSGHVDEIVRHAITKLSHIHFPAMQNSKKRILRLGEDHWRIFVAGAPSLDRIFNEHPIPKQKLVKKYNIHIDKPLVILIQHPVATQESKAATQIRITLQSLIALKLQTIVIYPNADAGGRRMIKVIEEYHQKSRLISSYQSIPHNEFLGLMKIASLIIGNSSCGIIEAASFKLPVVNIGIRQAGRQRSTNVLDVPHVRNAIIKAIKKALYNKEFINSVRRCKNPYGNGRASEKIVKALSNINLDSKLLQKKITY